MAGIAPTMAELAKRDASIVERDVEDVDKVVNACCGEFLDVLDTLCRQ